MKVNSVGTRSKPRTWAALAPLLTLALTPCVGLSAPNDVAPTPPPVSGRPLSDPESILPADVLARVALVRANVELLRRFRRSDAFADHAGEGLL